MRKIIGTKCFLIALISCLSVRTFGYSEARNAEDESRPKKRYDGVRLLRLYPESQRQFELLRHVEHGNYPKVQVVREGKLDSKRTSVDVMIDPETLRSIIDLIVYLQIPFETLAPDLQAAIDSHLTGNGPLPEPEMVSDAHFRLDRYHNHEEINRYLTEKSAEKPELVSFIEIGKSYEGRPLNVIKISSPSGKEADKPAMWLDAGIHSNEWIGPATMLYFIYKVTEQYNIDPVITDLIDTFDWYLMPIINVDGYVYTWTDDRMWRKSRSINVNSTCIGVDLNRNWDYGWDNSRGFSGEPCRRTYAGEEAESEPEIRALSNFLHQLGDRLKLYIAYHSFSQCWMMPFSHTRELPLHYFDMLNVSEQAVAAIEEIHGSKYHYGTVAELMGYATGSSVDYVYSKLGVKYSFGVELRDRGMFGSLLPPDQIIPNGEESLAAVLRVLSLIKTEYAL